MKQALQALIAEMEYVLSCINEDKIPFDGDDFHEALRLGKEALAQPAVAESHKQRSVSEHLEPVAWIVHDRIAPDRLTFVEVKESLQTEVTPLYTTPPQRTWVGLTDEEYKNLHLQMGSMYFYQDYGRAIEAKLKEKNT